jgi:hypothetical protein
MLRGEIPTAWAQVEATDQAIDELVHMDGLTEEEIKFVEGKKQFPVQNDTDQLD